MYLKILQVNCFGLASLINGFGLPPKGKVNSKYRSYYDGGNNEKICYDKTLTESP